MTESLDGADDTVGNLWEGVEARATPSRERSTRQVVSATASSPAALET